MTVLAMNFQDRGFPTLACSLLPPDSDDVRLSPPAPAPWEPRARVSEWEPRLSGSPGAREEEPRLSGSPGAREDEPRLSGSPGAREQEPRLSGSPGAREEEPRLSGSPGTRDDCLREPSFKEVRRCSDTAR